MRRGSRRLDTRRPRHADLSAGRAALAALVTAASLAGTGAVAERARSSGAPSAAGVETILFLGDSQLEETSLYTVRRDGRSLRRLTRPGRQIHAAAWSPDGRTIAVVADAARRLYVMNADTTGLRRLATGVDGQPSWSPDGRSLAYVSSGVAWVVTLRGARRAVARQAGRVAWAPVGTRILVGGAGSRIVDGRTGTVTELPPGTGHDGVWSRDGRKLLTSSPGANSLSIVDVATGVVSEVARVDWWGDIEGSGFDWSPDGSRVVFAARRDGVLGVFVADLPRRSVRLVVRARALDPRWSPSGRWIVYAANTASGEPSPGEIWNLFAIRPDGRGRALLTRDERLGGHNRGAAWRPPPRR